MVWFSFSIVITFSFFLLFFVFFSSFFVFYWNLEQQHGISAGWSE